MGKLLYNTYRRKRVLSTVVLAALFISTLFNGVIGVTAEIQKTASGGNEWKPWQPLSGEDYGLTTGNDGVGLEDDGGEFPGNGQGFGDMLGMMDVGLTTAEPGLDWRHSIGWIPTKIDPGTHGSVVHTYSDGGATVAQKSIWVTDDIGNIYQKGSAVVWDDPQFPVMDHVDDGVQFELDVTGYFSAEATNAGYDSTYYQYIGQDNTTVVPRPLWEIDVLLGKKEWIGEDYNENRYNTSGVSVKVSEWYLENNFPELGNSWDDELIRTYELYIDGVLSESCEARYPVSEYRLHSHDKILFQIQRTGDRWVVSCGEANFGYREPTVLDPTCNIYISNRDWIYETEYKSPPYYDVSPLTIQAPEPPHVRADAWNPAVYPLPSTGELLRSEVGISYDAGPMETLVTLKGWDANFTPNITPAPHFDTIIYHDDAALMGSAAARPIAFSIDTTAMNASLPPVDEVGTFVLSDYQISLNGLFSWNTNASSQYPYYIQVSDSVTNSGGQRVFGRRIDLCSGGIGADQTIYQTWNQSYASQAQMTEIKLTISKNSSFYIFNIDGNLFVNPSYGLQASETLVPGIFARAFHHYNPSGGVFAPSYRVRGPMATEKTDPNNPFYTGGERDSGILDVEKGDIALLSGTEITPFHLLSKFSGEPVKLRGTTDGNQLTFPKQRILDVSNTSVGLVIDGLTADSNAAGTSFVPGAVMALSFTDEPQPFIYGNEVTGTGWGGNNYNNVYGGKEFFRITLELNIDQGVRITPTPGEHRNIHIPLRDLIPGYQPGDPIINLPLKIGLYRPTPTSNDLFLMLNGDMLIKMDIAADQLGEVLLVGPKYLSIAAWSPNNSGNISWVEMTVEEIDGRQLCFLETAVSEKFMTVGDVRFNPATGAYTFRRNQDGSISYVQTNVSIPTPRNGTEAEIQFEQDAYVGKPPSTEEALMVSFAFTGTADGYKKMLSGEDDYGIYVEVYVLAENKLLIRVYTYYKGADGAVQRQQIGTDQTLTAENGTNLVQEAARIKVDIQFEGGDPSPLSIMSFGNTMSRRSPLMPMATGRTPTMWISVNNSNVVSHQEDFESGTAYAQVADQVFDQNKALYVTLAVRNAAEDTNVNLVELSVVSIDNKRVEFTPPQPEGGTPAPGNTGRTPSSYTRVPNQVILPLETAAEEEEAVTARPRPERVPRSREDTEPVSKPRSVENDGAAVVEPVVPDEPVREQATTAPRQPAARVTSPDTGVRNTFEPVTGPQVGQVDQTPSNLGGGRTRPAVNPPVPNGGAQWVRAREGSEQIVWLGDFELYAEIPDLARLADGEGMVQLESDAGNRGIALYKIEQDLTFNGIDVRVDNIPGFDTPEYDPAGDGTVIGMVFSDRNVDLLNPTAIAWRGFAVYITPLPSDEVIVEVYENANNGMVLTDRYTEKISVRPGSDISLYAGIEADNTWTLYADGHDHVLSLVSTDRYTFYGSKGYLSLYGGSNHPGTEPLALTLLGMNGSFIFTGSGEPTETSEGLGVGGAVNALSRLTLYRSSQEGAEGGTQELPLGINLNLVLALSSCALLGVALVTMKPWQGRGSTM